MKTNIAAFKSNSPVREIYFLSWRSKVDSQKENFRPNTNFL